MIKPRGSRVLVKLDKRKEVSESGLIIVRTPDKDGDWSSNPRRGWIEAVGSRKVTFAYRVEREGKLLATGSTVHVPVDADGRPRQFSRELLHRLSGYTGA